MLTIMVQLPNSFRKFARFINAQSQRAPEDARAPRTAAVMVLLHCTLNATQSQSESQSETLTPTVSY